MKKIVCLFLIMSMLISCLSGCQLYDSIFGLDSNDIDTPSENEAPSETIGSSPDNPIPFGEYAKVGYYDDQDIQMKIKKIYYDNDEISKDKIMVVDFEIKAVDLKGHKFNPGNPDLILKNGTEAFSYGSTEFNVVKDILCITFALPGTVVANSIYEGVDLSECKCLQYYNWGTQQFIYFALQ